MWFNKNEKKRNKILVSSVLLDGASSGERAWVLTSMVQQQVPTVVRQVNINETEDSSDEASSVS